MCLDLSLHVQSVTSAAPLVEVLEFEGHDMQEVELPILRYVPFGQTLTHSPEPPFSLFEMNLNFEADSKDEQQNIVDKGNDRIVKMTITFGKAYPRLQVQLETLTEPTSEVFEFAGHSRQESVTLGSR